MSTLVCALMDTQGLTARLVSPQIRKYNFSLKYRVYSEKNRGEGEEQGAAAVGAPPQTPLSRGSGGGSPSGVWGGAPTAAGPLLATALPTVPRRAS